MRSCSSFQRVTSAARAPLSKRYFSRYAFATQFQGAEMIAKEFGITREDTDRFGLRSQQLANAAWKAGRFDREVVPVTAPLLGEDGKPTDQTAEVRRDEGLRETSLEKLASLKAVEEAREQILRTVVDHIVTQKGDYRDLFTSRRAMISSELAVLYKLPVNVGSIGWVPYTFAANDPRAGILSPPKGTGTFSPFTSASQTRRPR